MEVSIIMCFIASKYTIVVVSNAIRYILRATIVILPISAMSIKCNR